MIYFPHPDFVLNSDLLVRPDLIKQVEEMCNHMVAPKLPPEWRGFNCQSLPFIALRYIEVLNKKFGVTGYNGSRRWLEEHAIGSPKLPEWALDVRLNDNHQGYLKMIGLGRLYSWRHKKPPSPALLADPLKLRRVCRGIRLPKGVYADYSHFDVEPCNTLLGFPIP